MTAGVAIALGLLPLVLLAARTAVAVGLATGRMLRWLLEEPKGLKGALARILTIAALLRCIGML